MSPTLFNVIVDAVIWQWYEDVVEDITTKNKSLGCNNIDYLASLFYADDGAVGSLDPVCIQNENQHLCNLFQDCVSLKPNTDEKETISFHCRVF